LDKSVLLIRGGSDLWKIMCGDEPDLLDKTQTAYDEIADLNGLPIQRLSREL